MGINDVSLRVKSWIICDDVKSDSVGKDLLLGVYRQVIVVPTFPFGLHHLIFRLALEVVHASDPNIVEFYLSFEIRDPKGNLVTTGEGPVSYIVGDPGYELTINLPVLAIQFPVHGDYTLWIAFQKQAKKKRFGNFLVRMPQPGDPTFAPAVQEAPARSVKSSTRSAKSRLKKSAKTAKKAFKKAAKRSSKKK